MTECLYTLSEIIKLSEENIGDRLHKLGGGTDFLNRTQKVLTKKGKK